MTKSKLSKVLKNKQIKDAKTSTLTSTSTKVTKGVSSTTWRSGKEKKQNRKFYKSVDKLTRKDFEIGSDSTSSSETETEFPNSDSDDENSREKITDWYELCEMDRTNSDNSFQDTAGLPATAGEIMSGAAKAFVEGSQERRKQLQDEEDKR